MTDSAKGTYPVLQVAQILDKYTLVVTGENVDKLSEDESLMILARGTNVPGVDVPLFVSKATVVVTEVPGPYAIVKAPTYEVQESTPSALSGFASILGASGTRTVTKRSPLSVDEAAIIGNPAVRPIVVGDPVIRRDDLQSFIRDLGQ